LLAAGALGATGPTIAAVRKPQIPVLAWYGPPAEQSTVERYRELAACGFTDNFSGQPDAAAILHCLEVGREAGVRQWVNVPEAKSEEVVRQIRHHPALGGYFLRDEPSTADFASLTAWVKRVQAVDTSHPCYINLLPTYATPAQLGVPTYQQYVDRFVAELPVPLLRQPLYRRFWAGRTISIFGDQVSALAIPLTAILVLHASAFEVGLLTSMAWLPDLLLALPAGVWIDARPHRRAVMIAADLLRAAVLVTIPVAWWLGALTVWQLLLVTFVAGSLKVFFDLASISFTIAIVPRSQYAEGQSRMMTSASTATVVGPSMTGYLVQAVGAPVALLVDAASFLW